jgi:hypothetical protein
MSTVNQCSELDAVRTPQIGEGVERRPNRSSCVQHVVHQNDRPAVEWHRHVGGPQGTLWPSIQIVSVHADVEAAPRNRLTFDLLESRCEALRQRDTPSLDTEENNIVQPSIALQNLVSDAPNGPIDVTRVHHTRHGIHLRT